MKRIRTHIIIGDQPWVHIAKQTLEEKGSVQMHFIHQPNWYEKRKEIFRHFKGIDISIERDFKHGSGAYVLLVGERIRTSDKEQPTKTGQKSAEQLHYPKTLPLGSRGTLADFEPQELEIIEVDGVKVYPCACCGHYLPEWRFGKRKIGSSTYKQSYCTSCNRAYGIWRARFLKEHKAEQLTPTFTRGNKQRNELFRIWYAEHADEIF